MKVVQGAKNGPYIPEGDAAVIWADGGDDAAHAVGVCDVLHDACVEGPLVLL